MKTLIKKTLAIILLFWVNLNLHSQTFQNIILTSFEDGILEGNDWLILDLDGDGNKWQIYTDPTIARTGSRFVAVKYNPNGNNDLLWSPVFNIPSNATSAAVVFYAKSLDPTYLESFEISFKTGSDTYLLGWQNALPSIYQAYSYDLTQFKGMSGWIEIICNSIDEYYLCIDDFAIGATINNAVIEENLIENISIYPNPVVDFISINVDLNFGAYYISLYDFSGRKIINQTESLPGICSFDLSWLSAGTYILKIEQKGLTKSYRVVKN